jgi:transcriptional regulator with XRE-family HTH domain
MENFGTRVRRLRLAAGYVSYPDADRRTGVKAGTWENIESRGKDPWLSTIQDVQRALGVSISELLDGVSGPGKAKVIVPRGVRGAPVPDARPDSNTAPPRGRRPPKRGAK